MSHPPLLLRQSMLTGALMATTAGCTPRSASTNLHDARPRDIAIALEPVPDVTRRGISNIFFEAAPPSLRDSMRTGDGWRAIEVADVVVGDGLTPIRAARFKMRDSDEVQYVVDTAGNLDFTHAPLLTFEQQAGMRVADLELTVRSTSGSQRRAPYQVLGAKDGYTYARIADYRTGNIHLDGRDYAVSVRNRSRNHPFYAANPGTVVMIDLDRDGTFAEQATRAVGGRPIAAEQVMPQAPFMLDGRAYELSSVDSAGRRLVIRPSSRSIAVAVNFKAPELEAELVAGGKFQLSKQAGKVVLIEFWATDCDYSEKVRAAANALAATRGPEYVWLAVAKETDRAAIEQHLVKSPMRASVTLSDSAAWATYNPAGATPTFVVVDQRGIIRLRATGASAMEAVAAKVNELLAPSSPR